MGFAEKISTTPIYLFPLKKKHHRRIEGNCPTAQKLGGTPRFPILSRSSDGVLPTDNASSRQVHKPPQSREDGASASCGPCYEGHPKSPWDGLILGWIGLHIYRKSIHRQSIESPPDVHHHPATINPKSTKIHLGFTKNIY